jgi:MFS family permease
VFKIDNLELRVTESGKKLFPQSEINNIKLFYWLTALSNAWFIAGNWIFFWTRYMTYGQLGIIDATAFAFGLIMEVPSGAISDMIGKRKTIITAMLLSAIGVFGVAMTTSMTMLWIFYLVAQMGWALYSGSAEALAYDTLVDNKKEEHYDEVISSSGAVSSVMTVVAVLTGAVLYVIHFRLPHLAWGLFYLIGFFVSLKLTEPSMDSVKFTFIRYFWQLKDGTKQLLKPILRPFLMVILVLLGITFLFDWGLVKPAMAIRFGFYASAQAIILSAFTIVGAITVKFIPKIRKNVGDKRGLYFLTLLMGAGFLLSYFPLGYFGLIPMILIIVSGHLAYPWVSIVINDEISSKYRATALSTVALITKLPYVALAVVAGKMVEEGKLNIFCLRIGLAVILSIVISGAWIIFSIKFSRKNLLTFRG